MLSVSNLDVFTKSNKQLLNDVSFYVEDNKTLCILGESGSGKSVLAYSIMDILHKNLTVTNGSITFLDKTITDLSKNERRYILGKDMSLIMQNPMTALDPTIICGKQIYEGVKLHNKNLSKKELKDISLKLLKSVNLNDDVYYKYPFEISGGMAQKVVICIAIANNPSLIIADEPITALDRKNSYEILDLLKQKKNENESSLIYISHDIDSVKFMADFILILYKGSVVEFLSIDDFNNNPYHPYTKDLLNSVIKNTYKDGKLIVPAKMDDTIYDDKGCLYYPYCTKKTDMCKNEIPLKTIKSEKPDGYDRTVKCINI